MNKNYLVVVAGPTALGKTRLAINLATEFNTSILSADSRQFYRELAIGTAVPEAEELNSAPHYFIQHTSIFEPYTVGDFEREALGCLQHLFEQRDIVIMAGGSGLYIKAITEGLDTFPRVSKGIRKELNDLYKNEGLPKLQVQLKKLDPHYHSTVDLNNAQRIIRALEVCLSSGRPYSAFLTGARRDRPFEVVMLGLEAPRDILYDRINRRVDEMMARGLLDEARKVFEHRELNALQTVGYKELFGYLEGRFTLETAVSEIKKNTRRYAKRQLTWFRKQANIHWIDYRQEQRETINLLKAIMDERDKK